MVSFGILSFKDSTSLSKKYIDFLDIILLAKVRMYLYILGMSN